ncbi:MAG: NUDIX domain-containing protein [Candidatus Omnitrophica bacterium]|nr:NUDIX domain-containing protein [Candidatus Omnitrophota bacterium]
MVMEQNKTESAGGVVISKKGKVLVVNQRGLSWSLPKGHMEEGEDATTAAIREIEEETGITRLNLVKELGSYLRYKIGLDGRDDSRELKHIHMFLFTTDELKLCPQDAHHPQARWVHPDDVEGLLTHPKDKAFFKSIRRQIP